MAAVAEPTAEHSDTEDAAEDEAAGWSAMESAADGAPVKVRQPSRWFWAPAKPVAAGRLRRQLQRIRQAATLSLASAAVMWLVCLTDPLLQAQGLYLQAKAGYCVLAVAGSLALLFSQRLRLRTGLVGLAMLAVGWAALVNLDLAMTPFDFHHGSLLALFVLNFTLASLHVLWWVLTLRISTALREKLPKPAAAEDVRTELEVSSDWDHHG